MAKMVAPEVGYTCQMSALPRAEAIRIYQPRYWIGPRLDQVRR